MLKDTSANTADARNLVLTSGSGRSPGGGHGNQTPVFLPGESHEQRSLGGATGHKELDTTEVP